MINAVVNSLSFTFNFRVKVFCFHLLIANNCRAKPSSHAQPNNNNEMRKDSFEFLPQLVHLHSRVFRQSPDGLFAHNMSLFDAHRNKI
jgi:hypothetical protein